MRLFRLSTLRLTLLLTAGFMTACSTTTIDPTVGWTPEKIYAEALDERASGNSDKAVQYFEKLEGRAAGTPLAQQAQLDKAYTHYKVGELPQAQVALDRFMRLHPASPAMDYALYLKGLVTFNDNLGFLGALSQQDLSERDQKAAKDSFESFRQLISRFPQSKYSSDARTRLTHIVNSLSQYEVHVARYYHRRGAHVAAINRAHRLPRHAGLGRGAAPVGVLLRCSGYERLAQRRTASAQRELPQLALLALNPGPTRSVTSRAKGGPERPKG